MTLQDLESAIAGLRPEELQQFRAWFIEFDSDAWDRQIEADVRAGKLDALADQALQEHRAGKTREL